MARLDEEVRTMDLRLFIDILRRRAWQIGLVTLAVVAVAVTLTYLTGDLYTSTATVEVRPLTAQEQVQPDASTTSLNMETEATRITQEAIASAALSALLDEDPTPEELEEITDAVSVTVQPGTTFLEISCTRGEPVEARECAQAFARAYVDDRINRAEEDVEASQGGPEGESISPNPHAAVVTSSADTPDEPSNKSFAVVVAVALLLGLLIGIGIALLRERLAEPVTDRLTFADALVAPVLAVVPDAPRRRKGAELDPRELSMPGGGASEAYRIARTTLQHVSQRKELKVFAVAGLDGGADATRTTAELAVALAQGGRRVVAISANLRKPALNRLLGVGSSIGLASVLTGEADLDEALLLTSTPGLDVIASGLTSDLPPELLDTDEMRGLVNELRSSFDFVVLDTAPQPWAADTLSLVPLTDGVIVTAMSGRTLREDVMRLRHLVEGVGGQIVGGILKERPDREDQRPAGVRPHPRRAPKPAPTSTAASKRRRDADDLRGSDADAAAG